MSANNTQSVVGIDRSNSSVMDTTQNDWGRGGLGKGRTGEGVDWGRGGLGKERTGEGEDWGRGGLGKERTGEGEDWGRGELGKEGYNVYLRTYERIEQPPLHQSADN